MRARNLGNSNIKSRVKGKGGEGGEGGGLEVICHVQVLVRVWNTSHIWY